MKLSEMCIGDIHIGQRVKSLHTGTLGTITNVLFFTPAESDDNEIVIEWDNGKFSQVWHFWLDGVETYDVS